MYNKGWCKVERDDSVKSLVAMLEPLVENLEENKNILADRKKELEGVSRLIAYTKDKIEMVGIYADQDIIIGNLDKIRYSVDDYKASCFLLKSDNESVKQLPQYQDAYNLISDIVDYFKLHKAELIVEIQELSTSCEKQEIEKKYYDILSCPNPLIENGDEFVDFMKNHGLNENSIVNILYQTIHDNIVNYKLKNN